VPALALPATDSIVTFAGGGVGDGGIAQAAQLRSQRVASDGLGDLFIADTYDCLIRKVTSGTITTVAGNGTCGYAGDGHAAVSAELNLPKGVAIDGSGDVYIADNCAIRKVSLGVITTVAGNGSCSYSGDGQLATSAQIEAAQGVSLDAAGHIYIADSYNCRVRVVTAGIISTLAGDGFCGFDGDTGVANMVPIGQPASIAATAAGDVYFPDGCRVRKVSGGQISTVAGTGVCGYNTDSGAATTVLLQNPNGLTIDAGGHLYIADQGNCRIREVSAGFMTTVAGDGTCAYSGDHGNATAAGVSEPFDVALDGVGNLYIADGIDYPGFAIQYGCRVREVSGTTISTFAGNGLCAFDGGDGQSALNGGLRGPSGIAIDTAGHVYIAEYQGCKIRRVFQGTITTIAGTGVCTSSADPGPAASASLNRPDGLAVDASGNLYIADTNGCRVRKIDFSASPATISTIAGNGVCARSVDPGPALTAELNAPEGVSVRGSDVYVSDSGNCLIREISGGTISTVAGNGNCSTAGPIGEPTGIAIDAAGHIYFADTFGCVLRELNGSTLTIVAGILSSPGACGGSPDSDRSAASTPLNLPVSVAVDAAGALYVGGASDCRVRKIAAGTSTTIAGGWAYPGDYCGFQGDGGPAFDSAVSNPDALAFDASGDLYIADFNNARLRMVAWDSDGDGCPDAKEPLLNPPTDRNNSWDFYSVPVPALFAAPDPTTVFRDNTVGILDAQSVFAYFKKGAKTGTTEYEQDLNNNGIKDGVEYDRTVVGPAQSGPPDGTIGVLEAQLAFSQFKLAYHC
jgi:sugar lactone lactonase YvrE